MGASRALWLGSCAQGSLQRSGSQHREGTSARSLDARLAICTSTCIFSCRFWDPLKLQKKIFFCQESACFIGGTASCCSPPRPLGRNTAKQGENQKHSFCCNKEGVWPQSQGLLYVAQTSLRFPVQPSLETVVLLLLPPICCDHRYAAFILIRVWTLGKPDLHPLCHSGS